MSAKSNLLIQEPPLQVLPSLAVAIGLNEALIIQQLHYWLENPRVGVERDSHKWIFNTYDEWQENFPFWSVSTIQRTFSALEKMGLVVSAQLDAQKHDMRKFYRIDYGELCKMDNSKLTSSKTPKRHDVKGTTETTSQTTDIDPVAAKLTELKFPFNPNSGTIIQGWKDDFPGQDDVIIRAIEKAYAKKARNLNYVDQIIISWKRDGVPLTREEQKAQPPQSRPKQSLQDFQSRLLNWAQQEGQAGAD